ncbi:uncharacterized protein BDZ99DRAFT_459125 [Mytilinidion resinicola]|uniref:Uncharacterized protein n=1 Tax=Mytilinidion resinicola TaxID=574789 RepID=A0A6A6Z4U3_9PEZI|nr:uncharacterized protein BDZ99DRAFT_459125 [Mytilinidion resinicola]KAF2815195.1 hypothetical protein BDZ99DRAFT_459125 [Mytilinidion resinicola]
MPPTKRQLFETYANASSASPPRSVSKRVKTTEKENDDESDGAQPAGATRTRPQKKTAELSEAAENENDDAGAAQAPEKISEQSEVTVQEDEADADADTSVSATTDDELTAREQHEAENAAQAKIVNDKMASPEGLEYRCMPRPWQDLRREWRDAAYNNATSESFDGESVEVGGAKEMERAQEESKRFLEKTPAEAPSWRWTVTNMANYLVNTYKDDAECRNPDNFGMYIYNDFAGYGLQEVIENQLVMFHEEFNKEDCDPHRLFVYMEAMAIWLFTSDMSHWTGLNDGARVSATMDIIGRCLLTSLNALERADLLEPGSKVKNIPMVLSMFLDFADDGEGTTAMHFDMDGNENPQTWPYFVVAYVNAHGIDIEGKGLYGIDSIADGYDDEEMAIFEEHEPGPDRWGFSAAFEAFATHWEVHAGQSNKYDIIAMEPEERMEYAFDHQDPLDTMDPDYLIH